MAKYAKDPRWIKARFNSKCEKCQGPIKKGEQAYYFPNGKSIQCHECGTAAEGEFNAAAWDEENNTCM